MENPSISSSLGGMKNTRRRAWLRRPVALLGIFLVGSAAAATLSLVPGPFDPNRVGTVGEWVSGIGTLLAVVIAVEAGTWERERQIEAAMLPRRRTEAWENLRLACDRAIALSLGAEPATAGELAPASTALLAVALAAETATEVADTFSLREVASTLRQTHAALSDPMARTIYCVPLLDAAQGIVGQLRHTSDKLAAGNHVEMSAWANLAEAVGVTARLLGRGAASS